MASPVVVLVVEDEILIQHLLEDELSEAGFAVAIASTGEEAVAMLDAEGANYSALITDVNLGGNLLGWDVARHARERNDKLPVIYMTGGSAHGWASKGVPNSQLMPKPFAIAQMITAVAQLINAAVGALSLTTTSR